jgi:hypothetical protein
MFSPMPKESSITEIESERRDLLRTTLSGSSDEAWPRVRQLLTESPSILPDKGVLTVWEGPSRGVILPLPFEVLRDFIRRFGDSATKHLVSALSDSEPLVTGYALHALNEIDPQRFSSYISSVVGRTERIHTIYGSFGWEGSLAEYAIRLRDDL